MARHGRFALVALVSLAIASTGVCSSLSAGVSLCPAAEPVCATLPANPPSCGGEVEDDATRPTSQELPTCRTCDDNVAFLLKGKTEGAKLSPAPVAFVAAVVPRAAPAIRAQADSLHLSQLSSSPPRHLLNVTFRN